MDAGAVPQGVCPAQVTEWRDAQATPRTDWIADEVPVALVFNGVSHAVMLASPEDLEDFALGFSITEGLLESPGELYGVEAQPVEGGIELRLDVAAACEWRLKERRRTLAGRTGCGLCGTDSLAQVRRELPRVPATAVAIAALARAQRELQSRQAVQHLTGATHAAAWCARDGAVGIVREDVGRHNALDKLIGAMLRAGEDTADGFVTITSRASFEMVQKTAAIGVGLLSAVSAPTALAVRTALDLGVALAGFVRGDDCVLYTFPERFSLHLQAHAQVQSHGH
ncbi:formate dehydrogenase accessory sulfurtransferase FdhD [Hydrogenophaga sp.]|uniref:formate dehydrogenase accessory sulfurtransferase FdhD n=1 Tax=Hydrogenophaga sp. TaxID=1904254 RepID=UPI00351DA72C